MTKDRLLGRNVEPRLEGVRVRTTPRLLIDALDMHLEQHPAGPLDLFMAKVSYVADPSRTVVGRLAEVGPKRLGTGLERAKSMMYKRTAFAHEQEVRVMALVSPETARETIIINIDPSIVFLKVMFDPRLCEFERLEREAHIRSLGFKGDVSRDRVYMNTYWILQLPQHWDVVDANQTA